mgnify:CR=1 FL=1|jgi:hypothetical protein
MRFHKRFLILPTLFFTAAILAEEDKSNWCELILGDWSGVHEPTDDRHYRFDAALDEDGSIMVDFDYYEIGETDRHEGYWECQDDIFTTGMATRYGGSILYQYQILHIDQESMTYKSLTPILGFNTYHSKRVGARTMTPELFVPGAN